jgi:hypothetical protein
MSIKIYKIRNGKSTNGRDNTGIELLFLTKMKEATPSIGEWVRMSSIIKG